MTPHFLGRGWPFPLAITEGQVARAGDEALVAQSIRLILGTAKGERVMRPDFGCDIHDLAFALDTVATESRIVAAVREALVLWEPRIVVTDVRTARAPDQPAAILIDLTYQIRATQSVHNMVYPFYLDHGGV